MALTEISVVVPVRDQRRYLESLCGALERQTLDPARFEVILINDGSTDGSRELLEAWVAADPTRRKLLDTPRVGPARAKNAGLKVATGEWVAFTDGDTTPDENWLETALCITASNGCDGIEGRIDVQGDGSLRPFFVQPSNQSGGRFMGGNMVLRRNLLQELNGFDPSLTQFLEDSDLALRALEIGAKIEFAPELRVSHPAVEFRFAQTLTRTKRVRWVPRFAKKHPNPYWSEFRPLVRPITSVDEDVIIGLACAAAGCRARGLQRAILALVAVHGIRRGLAAAGTFGRPTRELPKLVALCLLAPPLKAFWLVEGSVRFRKVVW